VAAPAKEPVAPKPAAVSSGAFVDARRSAEVEVPVTVTNPSATPVTLLVRPETIGFDVTGPTGIGVIDPSPTVRCAWPGPPPAPIAEAFTRLGAKESTSLTVLLEAMCPSGTLRIPGLYTVRARIDTRRASGRTIGVRTYEGEATSEKVTRVRVRQWTGAVPAAPRPVLAAPPAH
jgi:hypothetical protein